MSRTALVGAFGMGLQSAKGTVAPSITYFPVETAGVVVQQNSQVLPPEIGGSYLPRLSYKAGASASGSVSFNVRPDSFGHLLFALCGQSTDTAVPAQSGAYQHVMTPFAPSVSNDLPWYTLVTDVAKLYADQVIDSRLSSLQLSVPKAGVVTSSASFFGLTPSEIAVPGTEVVDTGPVFQSCVATVDLVDEVGQTTISANSITPDQVQMTFNSSLAQDEQVVGSYYPVDATLLQRTVDISYDITVRDAALVRAVYRNGGTSAWSPTMYRGHLTLTLNSPTVIGATTQAYQLVIDIPGMDFLMMPISMSGAQLIRANLSGQVTLGSAGDQFTFTLINSVASY